MKKMKRIRLIMICLIQKSQINKSMKKIVLKKMKKKEKEEERKKIDDQ